MRVLRILLALTVLACHDSVAPTSPMPVAGRYGLLLDIGTDLTWYGSVLDFEPGTVIYDGQHYPTTTAANGTLRFSLKWSSEFAEFSEVKITETPGFLTGVVHFQNGTLGGFRGVPPSWVGAPIR